jgi:hypothetical protein
MSTPRRYLYVGPPDLLERAATSPTFLITDTEQIRDALATFGTAHSQRAREVTVTFVVDLRGALRIAPRQSEHVSCAGGEPVLAAGEFVLRYANGSWSVCGATNQSTGYCPEPSSSGRPVCTVLPPDRPACLQLSRSAEATTSLRPGGGRGVYSSNMNLQVRLSSHPDQLFGGGAFLKIFSFCSVPSPLQ